ncbi:MAG TPA: 7-cyano-7-deazaguanine synthase [Phycisphaeraceae bacterium]
MAGSHLLILNSGGLRSLVATALTLSQVDRRRVTFLHVVDGRANAPVRLDHLHRQAEHFQIDRVLEVDMPHLYAHGQGRTAEGGAAGPLVGPQLLLTAMAQAHLHHAGRVIWPISCNSEVRAVAQATERMMLCNQLAETEFSPGPCPYVEAPLLELNDQQVIELGAQMGVPWGLSWSCAGAGESICRTCPACRRRNTAFTKAGLADPLESPRRLRIRRPHQEV